MTPMSDSPMRSWIRFWLKRNDREFEENVKREREEHAEIARRMTEEGRTEHLPLMQFDEWIERYDRQLHERNQFPVGAFFDMIDAQRHNGHKATADRLFVVAEVGAELFIHAIHVADEDDNAQFFIDAYERWGELVDTVIQEYSLADRDVQTGRIRETTR